MARPLGEQVVDRAWQQGALGWIAQQVPSRSIREFSLARVFPWSAVFRVETDDGRMWFKANCSAHVFEGALHTAVAQLVPDVFDQPVAIQPGEGWVLSSDFGRTWADDQHTNPFDQSWSDLVAEAARIQRVLSSHAATVLATGLPDFRPSSVLHRFDRLVELLSQLPDGHPAQLDTHLRLRILAGRSRLAEAVDVLADSPLPLSWNHGDLHPANVYLTGGRFRIFDFGDSNWTHPMEILCVPFARLTSHKPDPDKPTAAQQWPQLLAAYADTWQVPVETLATEWSAVQIVHGVNRSATWLSCLELASAHDWQRWGAAPIEHLSGVIDA